MSIKSELPKILATCVVCDGLNVAGCPCGVPVHPIYSEVPGKCNLAPIVYQTELAGLIGASKALDINLMQVCRARALAHQVDRYAEEQVFRAAAAAARMLRRPTFTDRIAAAIGV